MSKWTVVRAVVLSAIVVLGCYTCTGDAAAQGPGDPTPVSVGELVYSERGQAVGRVTHVLVERGRTLVLVEVTRGGSR